jgi:Zn-dependent protease
VRRFRISAGRLLGIRLYLHASWFLVLALVVWATTSEFAIAYPGLPDLERLAMAVITGLSFFACLAIHEVAHAVVARRFGIHVRGITLFLFGGVAEIEGEVPSPSHEFAVALVGPATSVMLGSIFALMGELASGLRWTGAEGVFFTLSAVNLGVALFNLIPGLPLDGGRLLRAGIWRVTGSFILGTRVAALGGRLVALMLAGVGILASMRGNAAGLWYVPMGAFIWFLARASGRSAPPVGSGALALERERQAALPGS